MAERVVLVTGSLAESRVQRVADQVAGEKLEPIVANVGVKVAALLTTEIVGRRSCPRRSWRGVSNCRRRLTAS